MSLATIRSNFSFESFENARSIKLFLDSLNSALKATIKRLGNFFFARLVIFFVGFSFITLLLPELTFP
jgi:hypothetical protein